MRAFLGDWKRTLAIGLTAGGAALATVEIEKRVTFLQDKPWALPAAALLIGSARGFGFLKKMPNVADGLIGYGGFYLTLFLYSKFVTKTAQQFTIGATAGGPAEEIIQGTGGDWTQAGALMGAGDMGGAYQEATAGALMSGDAGAMMGTGYIDNSAALSDAFGLES